jgi:hypothetical protein
MDRDDPRLAVEAPIRRALGALVARGLGLVAIVLLAVLCPVVPALHHFDDAIAVIVPVLLFAYAFAIFVERRMRGRPAEELRAAAWYKAREIDDADAMLALLIAGWVPVALLAALVVMAWPHLNDPSVTVRGVWGAIGVPTLAAAWLVASNTWLEDSRDVLARSIAESDKAFRNYWANLGR